MAEIIPTADARGYARVRSKKLSTHIDMTPMVDLAFLLLTFFILTTTLMKATVMEVVVPEKVENDPQPPVSASRVLTFILDANDKLYWRRGDTSPLQLVSFSHEPLSRLLEQKKSEINKMLVFVKATNRSRYKNMVDMIDELGQSKIDRYYIVDIEPGDEELITRSHIR